MGVLVFVVMVITMVASAASAIATMIYGWGLYPVNWYIVIGNVAFHWFLLMVMTLVKVATGRK